MNSSTWEEEYGLTNLECVILGESEIYSVLWYKYNLLQKLFLVRGIRQ